MDKKYLKPALLWGAFIALCFASYAAPRENGLWYSIIPPLLAVCLAVQTHKVIPSLIAAVLVGGVLSKTAVFSGLGAGAGFIYSSATDDVNQQILLFVALVMAMIAVLLVSGGLLGIVNRLSKYAKGRRSTQFVTVLMGIALFIDDYANTMMVGSTLRPLTDKHKVSREKLAFLVDATSAPIAGIAFLSTWIGYEVGLFQKTAETLGIAKDGYAMFFDAIPFRFYCLMMIGFVVINALSGRDFGPMAKAEKRAQDDGKLTEDDASPISSGGFATTQADSGAKIHASTALVPILGLLTFLIVGLWRDGGKDLLSDPANLVSWEAWRTVFSNADAVLMLALSAAFGLCLAVASSVGIARVPYNKVFKAIFLGLKASLLPITILILAWSLKGACDSLSTGKFLSATIGDSISPILFPAILFVVAGVTAFSTGTSWGTMAILIPTAVPVAYGIDGGMYGLTTIIALGAVLDGAIFGDHCSPISDTTIMSSIASQCDHIHHVRTQIPYALLVATIAIGIGYIPAASGVPALLCLVLGLAAIGGVFFMMKPIGTKA